MLATEKSADSTMSSGGEFGLIERHFLALADSLTADGVRLGIGDDCALLEPPAGFELAISTDTLVAGRHFPPETDPEAIGHKALAVNLSDLAAMGAEPLWVTLALSLPKIDDDWLSAFCRGFGALAAEHGIALVGGDTTASPLLSISLTVVGKCARGQALRRSGARVGDRIYVSGELGGAALGLRQFASAQADPSCRQRLERPEPRLALGRALRGVASACIDISDGLAADLGHICAASGVGAALDLAALPMPAALCGESDAEALALHGGDDYELCFCVPAEREMMLSLALGPGLPNCTRIGQIVAEPGLSGLGADGVRRALESRGFDHFAGQV
jgi:thiamine-monophosphate kinase